MAALLGFHQMDACTDGIFRRQCIARHDNYRVLCSIERPRVDTIRGLMKASVKKDLAPLREFSTLHTWKPFNGLNEIRSDNGNKGANRQWQVNRQQLYATGHRGL